MVTADLRPPRQLKFHGFLAFSPWAHKLAHCHISATFHLARGTKGVEAPLGGCAVIASCCTDRLHRYRLH